MDIYETHRVKLKCLVLGAAAAGKTSILRRYFYHTFEKGPSRVPTKGSDFYVGKLQEPVLTEDDETFEVNINLQMWDTPGRERFYLKQPQKQYAASLSDNFFAQADAVMLVYDMTSSTSFTQLLRWYADLMEINETKNHFPILIVGNKLDVFKATQQRASTLMHPRRVSQRDVMGLGGTFAGNDFQYEYRVSPIGAKRPSTLDQQRRKHLREEVSSFLANRENWTKDNSYLDSLLNSEDASHPDRDMVLLWCMRNGLDHLEVSAATGEGVQDAIVTLARMALEHKLEVEYRDGPDVTPTSDDDIDNNNNVEKASAQSLDVQARPKKIDLQERYRSKDEKCCFFLPVPTKWSRKNRII